MAGEEGVNSPCSKSPLKETMDRIPRMEAMTVVARYNPMVFQPMDPALPTVIISMMDH